MVTEIIGKYKNNDILWEEIDIDYSKITNVIIDFKHKKISFLTRDKSGYEKEFKKIDMIKIKKKF